MHTDLNLITPEQRITAWWNNLDSRAKLTFFAALLWGLVCHGMMLTNKYSIHDDITFLHSIGATFDSGRWMLGLISLAEQWLTAGPHYSMPLVNGLISLLFLALCAAILVKLFRIQSKLLCVALGCAMTAFPGVASLFGFLFTAPYYMAALLATVLAAAALCRRKNILTWCLSVAVMTCAMGVYQAYIPVAIGILLLHFLLERLDRPGDDWAHTIKTAIYYGSALLVTVLAYYVANKVFLKILGLQLNSYQGISSMGREGLGVYLTRALLAYKAFFFPEQMIRASDALVVMGLQLPWKILLALDTVLLTVLFLRSWKERPWKALQVLAVSALLPLAFGFAYVMGPDAHTLMIFGQCLTFLLTACLVQRLGMDKALFLRLVSLLLCLLLVLFPLIWCRYDNALYMDLEMNQQRTISWFNTLITRIKSAEGYRDELPISYVGRMEKQDQTLGYLSAFPYIWPYESAPDLINDSGQIHFMEKWCGFWQMQVEFDHPDIASMPCYPDDGSIRVIDDVIVVKFS